MGPQGWASVAAAGTATIQSVLCQFLEDRRRFLNPADFRLYGHVLLFLQLCINNYGHRNLDEEDRTLFETLNRAAEGEGSEFFELFGAELLLPELDFFSGVFLRTEVHTSEKVLRKAKEVVSQLRLWLVASGYLTPERLLELDEMVKARARFKRRLRPLLRRFEGSLVAADPSMLAEEDHVASDAHLVGRVEPGRIWLRVHRTAVPEEIGPVALPEEITCHLRRGFTLWCSLGRLRGRWRLLELSEVHPRG
jgi:hypothetical protein